MPFALEDPEEIDGLSGCNFCGDGQPLGNGGFCRVRLGVVEEKATCVYEPDVADPGSRGELKVATAVSMSAS
jgi:hypothetical protein